MPCPRRGVRRLRTRVLCRGRPSRGGMAAGVRAVGVGAVGAGGSALAIAVDRIHGGEFCRAAAKGKAAAPAAQRNTKALRSLTDPKSPPPRLCTCWFDRHSIALGNTVYVRVESSRRWALVNNTY